MFCPLNFKSKKPNIVCKKTFFNFAFKIEQMICPQEVSLIGDEAPRLVDKAIPPVLEIVS